MYKYDAYDHALVRERIDEFRDTLSSLPQCFCHNDLSNTNVHRDGQTTRLIDFEFAGRNYRGFDLAVHFSHWAGGAVDGRYNDAARVLDESIRLRCAQLRPLCSTKIFT